jgi:hypothetical protein
VHESSGSKLRVLVILAMLLANLSMISVRAVCGDRWLFGLQSVEDIQIPVLNTTFLSLAM